MKKYLLIVLTTLTLISSFFITPTYCQTSSNCVKQKERANINSALKAYRYLENQNYGLAALEICKIEQTKRTRKKMLHEKWKQFSLLYNWTKANLYIKHYKPINIHSAIHHAELAKNIYLQTYKDKTSIEATKLAEKRITDEYMQLFIDSLQTPPCPKANLLCDDGNPETINDKEDGNCNCVGEIPPPPLPTPAPVPSPKTSQADLVVAKIENQKEELAKEVKQKMAKLSSPSPMISHKNTQNEVDTLVLKASKINLQKEENSKLKVNVDASVRVNDSTKTTIGEKNTKKSNKSVSTTSKEQETSKSKIAVAIPKCADDLNPLDLRVVFEYTDKGDGINTFAALKKTEYTNRFISKALEVLQETLDEQYQNLSTSKKIKGFITGYATNQPIANLLNINNKYMNALYYNKEFGTIPHINYRSVIGKDAATVTYDGGNYSSLIESQQELAFIRAYSVKFRLVNASTYIDEKDVEIVTSIVDNEEDGGKVQITLDIENAFNVYLSDLNEEMKKEVIRASKKNCVFKP